MQPDVDIFEKLLKDNQDLQKSQNLPITPKRIHQLLRESPNLIYRNRKTAPALTAKHKMRVDWENKKVTWTMKKWRTWCFLMRKRLIWMGPTAPSVIGMI